MDSFIENFSKDSSADKRFDFVSWHEYGKSYHGTPQRLINRWKVCGFRCWPITSGGG